MLNKSLISAAISLTLVSSLSAASLPFPYPPVTSKANFDLAAHLPVEGVAEIIAATPNGRMLVYTNASEGKLGFVDINNPSQPKTLPSINVQKDGVGEPTSVAITPDGKYAVVVLRMGDDVNIDAPGLLRVYDLSANMKWIKDVTLGTGPDSIGLIGSESTLRAVVAIENEETDAEGDATVPGVRPGRIDIVSLKDLYKSPLSILPAASSTPTVQSLDLVTALTTAGGNYPNDPQPEYVTINKSTNMAAVTLQENNAIALVDLRDPNNAKLAGVFSTGSVTRTASADLLKDGEIKLAQDFQGRREADGIAWVGNLLATANEGDTSKSEDGVFGGSRSFSLFNTAGQVVYESGEQTEKNAVLHGFYPDSRSAKGGVEMEGVISAQYSGATFMMVGSERGGFIDVLRVDNAAAPQLVQSLPTGLAPEGLTSITGRSDQQHLFAAANEGDGSITIYRFHPGGAPANAQEPQLVAAQEANEVNGVAQGIPWGALSGLSNDGTYIYAVADNAFAQSRIYRINPADTAKGRMVIEHVTMLTEANNQAPALDGQGTALKVDPEGIAVVTDGFWIASEGAKVADNELIRVNMAGVVQERIKLSDTMKKRFADAKTSTGFEGVTASAEGRYLYVAVQRGFDPKNKPTEAAILRYDTQTQTWISALYPLDQHSKDATKYWTGLSEITLLADGRLLVLERDKGGGENGAINAEIKRVYSVNSADLVDGALLSKTLVRDLRKDFSYLHEKIEGMTVFGGNLWVVNDNDGAGWTRMLNSGKL